MKLKTLLIDDEPIALEKLRTYAEKTPSLEVVAACSNAIEAAEILSETPVDLIFTDINMPDMSGLELVESLATRPMIVYTTAYAEYAVESYRHSAIDYLLKPYRLTDFQRAANKAQELYTMRHSQHEDNSQQGGAESRESIYVKVETRYVRIATAEIRYIKSFGEYLQVFIEGRKLPVLTAGNFVRMMEMLPGNFLQVHRSYAVNMDRIQHAERNRIVMDAETAIPVGDSYKETFKEYLRRYTPLRQ